MAALESNTDKDWTNVDQKMLQICQECGVSLGDIRELVGKVICRLGYSPEIETIGGDPTDTYVATALTTIHRRLAGAQGFHQLDRCGDHLIMHRIQTLQVATLVSVSDGWCHLFGYEPEEVLGRPTNDFLTEESRHRVISVVYPNFLMDGVVDNERIDVVSKAGKVIPVNISSVAERNSHHEIVRGVSILSPML
ncbi:MAG: PAS domain-containing protein [Geminicoccaceae bacterium]